MSYNLPKRTLVSQNENSLIERNTIPRSQLKNRYGHKTAFDAGVVVPVLIEEVLPGDHVRYNIRAMIRTAEPLLPLMDSMRVDFHLFYCPIRVIWPNFEKMLGAQSSPGDSTNYTVPVINGAGIPANGPAVGSIWDYMGIPTEGQITAGQGPNLVLNALPMRVYNRTWQEWYKDQNLQSTLTLSVSDGPDTYSWYLLRPRNKAHDRYTTALPAPQKGQAPSLLSAVQGLGVNVADTPTGAPTTIKTTQWSGNLTGLQAVADAFASSSATILLNADPVTGTPLVFAEANMNAFRMAIMMQTVLERDMRGGTRYNEQMFEHWGVNIPDYRVQRPEYIGGGSAPVTFTPVANTNADGTDALGTLGAAGTADGSITADYASVEHGYIICMASIRTELSYQQGLHPLWSRRTRWDFPIPALMQLGEEPIYRRELFCTGAAANDAVVFGYGERWGAYRQEMSRVSGIMRSTAAGNIDEWHAAQLFSPAPTLSDTFIRDTPPTTRIFAAGSAANGQQFKMDMVTDRTITRAMPVFSTPATLGRF